MSNPLPLPPPPIPIDVPGGPIRPSIRVAVPDHPALTRRRELNERLDRDCLLDDDTAAEFGPKDLDLLDLTTRERFSGADGEILRQRAVSALGKIRSAAAVARLVSLATNPVEPDGIRIAALAALPRAQVRILAARLAADASLAVREFLRWRGDGRRPRWRGTTSEPPRFAPAVDE